MVACISIALLCTIYLFVDVHSLLSHSPVNSYLSDFWFRVVMDEVTTDSHVYVFM